MMWINLSLLASLLWASVNHIDKYLISKFTQNHSLGALFLISALISLPLIAGISILSPSVLFIDIQLALLLIAAGAAFSIGLLPYFYAMNEDETSIVAPLSQFIPIFALFLAYILLGEKITAIQLLGGLFITSGAIFLVLEKQENNFRIKKKILIYMLITSFMIGLSATLYKMAAEQITFIQSLFWQYIGNALTGIGFYIVYPPYRKQFIHFVRSNSKKILLFNCLNESLTVIGNIAVYFASLITSVSLVYWVAEGFQPVFIFLLGIILWKLKIKDPETQIAKKVISILMLVAGSYLLSIGQ